MILLTEGSKVTYIQKTIEGFIVNQHGIIKSFPESHPSDAFVVFHCAGEWDNYQNYTAQKVPIKRLKPNWL